MTELSTEPVAAEAAPTPPPPPPEPQTTASKDAAEVEHTPGGWPVVPLALTGANSTVGGVAAVSLAGGPIAALVAVTGAVVLGTVAATRSRTPNSRREARRAAARAAGRSAARSAGLRQSRTGAGGTRSSGGRSSASRAGRGGGGRSGSVPGQHRRTSGQTGTVAGGKPRGAGQGTARRATGAAGRGLGRVGQVRALRAAQQATAGTRAERRAQTTAARRAVADARRDTRGPGGAGRAGGRGGRGPGVLAGAAHGAVRRARAGRDAAVARNRARRDARNRAAVDGQRQAVRRAPARRAARQALRRSAARFHGRRLLAALLALPVGLLGCLTTWIGRRLGIPGLMHPGRRLYRRMTQTAAEQRAARDQATRARLREQEAAADAEAAEDGTDGIADSIERPAATVPTSTTAEVSEGEHVSGFRFEEVAAEMEQAATQYDPENAMEILAMVEGLPAALTSVANVMKILAERSDSEFPLEKEVADGFNDIFGALMSAVAVAEDMGPLFRQAHEQDIARHEDPRNGHEAEKGWNV
ncbi:hypothetical protein [Streptomyces sp. NRRL S-813]|uniref:hypothetical protein n=1 Tax=Streptomyces sp. NRRL S-813 TaxID=1463919 RepID=UPI0004C000C6|nr:hypothetical protein [Streptomyces sp. NRRL S-813]